MSKTIFVLNGPNLNMLGKREPGIYGSEGFESYLEKLKESNQDLVIEYFQSNIEGELIDAIQKAGFSADGIILNPGGYTHTSVAIGDAIASITAPVIEVHISNVHAREAFRHHSVLADIVTGQIAGFGLDSYALALRAAVSAAKKSKK